MNAVTLTLLQQGPRTSAEIMRRRAACRSLLRQFRLLDNIKRAVRSTVQPPKRDP